MAHSRTARVKMGNVALFVAFCLATVASGPVRGEERITPLLLAGHDPPVPFGGSDGRTHLVYELWITNFSSGEAALPQGRARGDGRELGRYHQAAIATRLQPAGRRDASDVLPGGGTSLLFAHVPLAPGARSEEH